MSNPPSIVLGPVRSQLRWHPAVTKQVMALRTAFKRKRRRYSRQYKRWINAGHEYFISKDGTFQTGLTWNVLNTWFRVNRGPVAIYDTDGALLGQVQPTTVHETLSTIFSQLAGLPYNPIKLNLEYRSYLVAAVKAFMKCPRGIWDAATNSGKTFMTAAVCGCYSQSRILILVPEMRTVLIGQGRADLEQVGLQTGIMKGPKRIDSRIVYGSIGTLRAALKKAPQTTRQWLRTFDLLIKDECHEHSVNDRQIVSEMSCWARLGMSGTVFTKDAFHDAQTSGMYGPVIHKVTNKYLVEHGYSVLPYIYAFWIDHPKSLDFEDYEEFTNYLMQCTWRNQTICDLALFLRSLGHRVVISCHQKAKHAQPLVRMLSRYTSAEVYTGDLTEKNRNATVKRFESGQTQILVATRIFDTGVSIDCISAVVSASGNRKRTIQLQRYGRGLRTGGRSRFVYVDMIDDCSFSSRQGAARLKVWKEDPAFKVYERSAYTQLIQLIREHEHT